MITVENGAKIIVKFLHTLENYGLDDIKKGACNNVHLKLQFAAWHISRLLQAQRMLGSF